MCRFSEIAPSAAQAMINEYNIQNLPFTIDPSLCHQEMAQEQEDVELLDIDAEELARDRLVTNTDSPFLLNFDLDNHHLDAMDVPTA